MEMRDVALEWMRRLDMMGSCIRAFRGDKLWQSEGSGIMSGILYEASEDVLQKAKEIEKESGLVVWHVIRGTYIVGGDQVQMDTYLLAEENEVFDHERNNYVCYAYVDNKTYPVDSEYGSVLIKNANGGLKRIG